MAGAQAIEILLSWIVTTTLTFLVVIDDERRLSEDRLERAWPKTSRDAAIVAFGVLALPIHFIKTRGHFRNVFGALGFVVGLLLGIVEIIEVGALSNIILTLCAYILRLPID